MMRVVWLYAAEDFEDTEKTYHKRVEQLSNSEYKVVPLNIREYARPALDSIALDNMYRYKDSELVALYAEIRRLTANSDLLVSTTYNMCHPEFLEQLDVYKTLITADDPVSSYRRTVPYVHAFSHVFCVNTHYDATTTQTAKLLQWGARRADWLPIMVWEVDWSLTEKDIIEKQRDIDLVYVGGMYRTKIDRILKVKKAFGRKMFIRGTWRWKHRAYALCKYGIWEPVRRLPINQYSPALERSRIGINMHDTFELGNTRLYSLPLHGVMQICDLPKMMPKVFENGKEIVAYNTIEEAIELIRYYLEHEEERIQIALAGFRRARRDYNYPKIFQTLMAKVKNGMIEDGLTRLKDGTLIRPVVSHSGDLNV